MAELLVMRKQIEPHPDPLLRASHYQPGMVITIQEDGYPWHPEVSDPNYHAIIVRIPGIGGDELQHLLSEQPIQEPALGSPRIVPRVRLWVLPIEAWQPTMTKDALLAAVHEVEAIHQ